MRDRFGCGGDAQTVYPIGSNTKQFTAAVTLLQEVPDAPHGSEITVQELLGRTSGLPA